MNTGIIIQARTGSTRLPEKILKELPFGGDVNVLQQVIRRCKKVKGASVIVATTTQKRDVVISEIAAKENVAVFRGSEDDVLLRYYEAAVEHKLDRVVRITSDCPCVDPEIIETLLSKLEDAGADYVSNVLERTYPHGLDAEAFTFDALKKAHKMAKEGPEREHVTYFIYTHKDIFNVVNMPAPEALYGPDIRITLDTEEDYLLLSVVYDFLYKDKEFFDTKDVVDLFRSRKYLTEINSGISQKKVCEDEESEIGEAIRVLDLQGLKRASNILKRV